MNVGPLKAQERTKFHGAQARLAACGMVANPALGDTEFCSNFFGGVKTICDIRFRWRMNGDCEFGIVDGHIGAPFGYEDLLLVLFSVSGKRLDRREADRLYRTHLTLGEKFTLDLFHFEYTYSKLEYLGGRTLLREDHVFRFS